MHDETGPGWFACKDRAFAYWADKRNFATIQERPARRIPTVAPRRRLIDVWKTTRRSYINTALEFWGLK
jgi:hypothetical protein